MKLVDGADRYSTCGRVVVEASSDASALVVVGRDNDEVLDGQVEAKFDGESFVLGPGDIAWAGVGCVHEFRNVGDGIVRWLETQAPAPPPRHSYRFARDWTYLETALADE